MALSLVYEEAKAPDPSLHLLGAVRIFVPMRPGPVGARAMTPSAKKPRPPAEESEHLPLAQLDVALMSLPESPSLAEELPSRRAEYSPARERTESWESAKLRSAAPPLEKYLAYHTQFATAVAGQERPSRELFVTNDAFPAVEERQETGGEESTARTGEGGFGSQAVRAEKSDVRDGTAVRFGTLGDVRAAHAIGPQAGAVHTGAFGEASASPALSVRQAPASPAPPDIKILFKPRPAYSENARALHIEGNVWLEVVFTRAGEVRVVRVLEGLGHGLDEQAMTAARGIRFQPAVQRGEPVDFTARLAVTFQLAY